jgi:hypothetical protein
MDMVEEGEVHEYNNKCITNLEVWIWEISVFTKAK